MDKQYRVLKVEQGADPAEMEDAMNALHEEGYELCTSALSGWKADDLSETNAVLIFQKRPVFALTRSDMAQLAKGTF